MCDQELLRENSIKKPASVNIKNDHVLTKLMSSDNNRLYRLRTKFIISGLVILVLLSALCGYLIGSLDFKSFMLKKPELLDPVEHTPPSPSWLHVFKKAAVCSDSPKCADVGRHILSINGSAVDAAIATMFCNGLHSQQSTGLGGGFFMTLYIKEEQKVYSVVSREKAPAAATSDMFHGIQEKSRKGPLASAIPGELRGMWAIHKRWGKLPWKTLIQPTLEFCKYGYRVSNVLYDTVLATSYYIKNDPHLRKTYYDSSTNKFYTPGSVVKPSEALCNTFKTIAEKGGDDLYNGTLAVEFLKDLQRIGSIITADDLKNYQPKFTEPLSVSLGDGDILYTPPPPSGGALLIYIMNILRGYNFTSESINGTDNQILTYHRIIEAFKYAYAARTKLGDSDFLDLNEFVHNITSQEYGDEIRKLINDTTTSNSTEYYGASLYTPPDSGTSHLSIIASNGDAVSLTSSINYYFGAGYTTLNTGILMNNVMDDFSSPGITSYYGLEPSPANFIVPGKRPMSTISPSIIIDKNGNTKMVIGSSGGTMIVSSTALVTIRKLWFDQTIKEAVDEPRLHHQLLPMSVNYEFGVVKDVVNGLRAKGHGMDRYTMRGSNVCALYRNKTAIFGNADIRKSGDVAGID